MSSNYSSRYRDLLNRLSGVRVSGKGHIAKCPGHNDSRPSLSLREDGSHILLHCFAGCKPEHVLASIGLDFSAVDPPTDNVKGQRSEVKYRGQAPAGASPPAHTKSTSFDTCYFYRTELGVILYRVVRAYEGGRKFFYIQHPNPDNPSEWLKGKGDAPWVLYHLPFVVKAVAELRPVYIVEGEKDVKTLESLGFTATTNACGAGKWRPEYVEWLRGGNVVILPDNDEPGRAHAEQVAASLHGVAARVRVLPLPGLEDKQDVFDWLKKAGNSPEDLIALADATPEWAPDTQYQTPDIQYPRPDTLLTAPLTDAGNAERLIARHGPDLRWDFTRGVWRMWDGMKWAVAEKGEAVQKAIETVRAIIAPADTLVDRKRGDDLIKHARKSESEGRIKSLLTLAQALPGVSVAGTAFDADGWLLNTPSGTLDLRTGTLQKHRRDDLLAKITAVPYDPDAQCPRWEQFLKEIFDDDAELVAYLQRLVGYCLTSDTREQALFLFTGKGSNGKTLLLETLRDVFGDYARATPFDTLLERRDTASYDLAGLVGARMVTATEGAGGRAFCEPRVKQLSGGDPVSCRFLYRDFFSYTPTFKLAIATNEAPRLTSQDYSLKRRLQVVPFGVTFYTVEDGRTPVRDPLLREKLKTELPGILAWAVRGCLDWQAAGLQPPACIGRERDALFESFDIIGEWFDQCCEKDLTAETPSADLWKSYVDWCEANKQPTAWKSARGLSNALKQRDGISLRKGTGGVRIVCGVKSR